MFLNFGAEEGTEMASVFFGVSFSLLPKNVHCETILQE